MTTQTGLDGAVALVTGASEGLGTGIARALRAAGARTVLAARRRDRLDALAAELGGPDVALAVACDVTVDVDRKRLLGETRAAFGPVDVLVNNAGTAAAGPAQDEPAATVDRILATNLTAPYRLCQLVAPEMLASGHGAIVTISSIGGRVSFDRYGLGAYAASKAGIDGLTRELAAQWGPAGVRVNAVAPGWFPGGSNGHLADPDQRAWIAEHTALQRPGTIAEVAAVVAFLASPAASYVTGQVLCVDGGWTCF